MREATESPIPNVIIADDAQEIREYLQVMLEECDCNVIASAEDGEQAIDLLKQYAPDIIFLDIEMPKKNGFEILEAIREQHIPVYAIMVSRYSSKENFSSALMQGARDFIVKPLNQKKIEQAITAYLVANK